MLSKKVCALLVVVCFLGAIAAGCGSTNTAKKTTSKNVLRYSVGAEPSTIDPRKSNDIPAVNIESQIFEGLTTIDKDNKIVPAAAEKWEVSSDGLKYTFYLRPNMKWSNGDPLTAHDFEYSWKSTLSPELGSKYAYQLYYIVNAEAYNKGEISADKVGIKAKDDRTLEVTLNSPTPYFTNLMAHHSYYPVHKKTVDKNDKWAGDAKTVVGNGPFKLVSWVHNSKMELVKNENYWDAAKVKLAKVDIFLTDNNSTELSMFESGQIDMGDNPPTAEFDRLKKENKLKVFPYFGTYYFCFNVTKAPLDNVKVRKALSLALNREAIVKNISKGGEQIALGFVPFKAADAKPGDDFRKNAGELFKDNDIATAKKMLAEAGYPDGKGLPPITIMYNTSELHKSVCEAVQEMWKKNLGIEVNLTNQEWKVFLNTRHKGDYQVARHGWIGDYLDPMTMLELFVTKGGNNDAQYSNDKYDELIKFARSTNDQGARFKALHDAEKLLMQDDAVVAPVYFYTKPIIVKPNIKGLIRSPLGQTYLKEAYFE